MSLYKDENYVKYYPIAIWKPSTPTPKGNFKIVNRLVNPGGLFGARWLGLKSPGGDYGLHGTNNPSSIGKAVFNGCISTYRNIVIELANLVPIGTSVTII